jgi:hypothetical protein
MNRKLIFTSGTVVLTHKLCFWNSQHDLPKSMEMVIFQCFSDDNLPFRAVHVHAQISLFKNLIALSLIKNMIDRHVLRVIVCWKVVLNQL